VRVARVEDKCAAEAGGTVNVGHECLQHSSRPWDATYLRYSPAQQDDSGGLGGTGSHSGAPARGACLRRWSLGLNFGGLPFSWPRTILPPLFLSLLK
jgi:hypothetical protein